MAFAFQFGDEEPTVKAAVFQALGAASVAWKEVEVEEGKYGRPGRTERVFDEAFAREVGNELLVFIAAHQLSGTAQIAILEAMAIATRAHAEFKLGEPVAGAHEFKRQVYTQNVCETCGGFKADHA